MTGAFRVSVRPFLIGTQQKISTDKLALNMPFSGFCYYLFVCCLLVLFALGRFKRMFVKT